ncbi:hypothetical protein [Marinobacterium lutimaris]|uniref:Uncharacterized protein n=1 Tax=Marinobacterium lutimaris TaxID=568106 RepID=A0A1H5YDH9_9GAMM|nr:hypothetical protein [Marinobacterium lutimaris]SEG21677.1 hypothetical protein SAMN05444390_1011703 [Marinobacterium lutimaris]
MKVESTTVRKLMITEIEALDPISVIIENHEPGKGKIIIECYGDAWSSYWGAMSGQSIEQFFLRCDEHYLANKLSAISSTMVADTDEIRKRIKADIVKMRRQGELSKEEADHFYRRAEDIEIDNSYCNDHSLVEAIWGEEWFRDLHEVPNPKYEYLCRIIRTVQIAIRETERVAA